MVVAAAFICGCAGTIEIHESNPKPDTQAELTSSVRLHIGDTVPDSFQKQQQGPIRALRVQRWRSTLLKGFTNAFGTESDSAGVTVSIVLADLELVSRRARVSLASLDSGEGTRVAHGGPSDSSGVTVKLTYRAHLLDREGNISMTSKAAIRSGRRIAKDAQATRATREAVEFMYEKIAHDFFPQTLSEATFSVLPWISR